MADPSATRPTDYDTIADSYTAAIDTRPWNALYERPATLALLPDISGKDVIDLGCGHGWYAEWLVGRGARVTAIDLSAKMAAHAERRLRGRARVFQRDACDLRGLAADGTFDVALSSLMAHYLPDLAVAFSEWARVLRPGGRLVMSTHHPFYGNLSKDAPYFQTELVSERWGWLGTEMRFYRRPLRDLTESLAKAGFVIERICEPEPSEALRSRDPRGYDWLRRSPGFLFVRARKPL